MDIRKVKKLIELLEESGITEIEIHEGEESVRVSRGAAGSPVTVQGTAAVGQDAPAAALNRADGSTARGAPAEPVLEGHVVRAPMVGIFYESPASGKPPFVELGKAVRQGEILCVIEAMKIMNQIEADASGIVSRVLVENGEPVEYGQPLFVIRES